MTASEFRYALNVLRINQLTAGRLLGVDGRTVRRWCADEGTKTGRSVPPTVERFLRYLILAQVDPNDVFRAFAEHPVAKP
jgi:hypothetical protein